MDRRGFFKAGMDQVTRIVVDEMNNKAVERATHWIRPPYALDELEFLLTCTRCDKCVEACPHNVIFLLAARLGSDVAGTPAMDLLNRGCHLCEDWPCVAACQPGALKFTESDGDKVLDLPLLARAEINPSECLPYSGPECGACASSCPVPGALVWDGTRPGIDPGLCTGCGLCREACVVEPKAVEIRSMPSSRTGTF